MQPLVIESDDDSPKVVLDSDKMVFLMEGESRPQHAFKFFKPILDWLEGYKKELSSQADKSKAVLFKVNLSYFNSTSAKFLGDIFFLLDDFCKEGLNVSVKWHYLKEDIDMKETAEEYQKIVKKLPIQLELIPD